MTSQPKVTSNEVFECDRRRPYKLYAAMVSAFLSSVLLDATEIPPFVVSILVAANAALAVYLVPNPIVKRNRPL